MKISFSAFSLMLCVMVGSSSAVTISFQNWNDYIYTSAGGSTLVNAADAWVVALYKDVSNNGIGAWGDADDVLMGQITTWGANGWLDVVSVNNAAIVDGSYLFVRVFNAGAIGSATEYVNIDMVEGVGYEATRQYAVSLPPATSDNSWTFLEGAQIGGSAANGSDWIAIPEPGTMGLFGVGLVTFLARRKKKQAA